MAHVVFSAHNYVFLVWKLNKMVGLVYRYIVRLLEKDMVTVLYLACKETR